jgi:Ca2+ transporting ATPase
MLQVLIVCAFFSIAVEMAFADPSHRATAWIEGFAILVAVAVVSLVTAVSDYKKEGQFLAQLSIEIAGQVVVVRRHGKEETIHRDHLKVGDLIKIQNGMNIPVDGVCIEANGVLVDGSAMTGESDHLMRETYDKCFVRLAEHEAEEKFTQTAHDIPSPIVLSGTQIQTGQGWFLTIVVDKDTCENQILAAVEQKSNETTPLQDKLEVIATDIGKLGMYCAILIIHCLLLRRFIESMMRRKFDLWGGELTKNGEFCSETTEANNEPCDGNLMGFIRDILGYLIVGVAIVVVAVPEGLPLAVMISLSYSISKML